MAGKTIQVGTKQIPVLSSKVKPLYLGDELYLQRVSSPSKFKMPKAQRDAISKSLKQFKFPLMTVASLTPYVLPAVATTWKHGMTALRGGEFSQRMVVNSWVTPLSGIAFYTPNTWNITFDWKPMLGFYVPVAANVLAQVFFGKYLTKVNQKLARMKLPVRFN